MEQSPHTRQYADRILKIAYLFIQLRRGQVSIHHSRPQAHFRPDPTTSFGRHLLRSPLSQTTVGQSPNISAQHSTLTLPQSESSTIFRTNSGSSTNLGLSQYLAEVQTVPIGHTTKGHNPQSSGEYHTSGAEKLRPVLNTTKRARATWKPAGAVPCLLSGEVHVFLLLDAGWSGLGVALQVCSGTVDDLVGWFALEELGRHAVLSAAVESSSGDGLWYIHSERVFFFVAAAVVLLLSRRVGLVKVLVASTSCPPRHAAVGHVSYSWANNDGLN